jgi:hypothetical protein
VLSGLTPTCLTGLFANKSQPPAFALAGSLSRMPKQTQSWSPVHIWLSSTSVHIHPPFRELSLTPCRSRANLVPATGVALNKTTKPQERSCLCRSQGTWQKIYHRLVMSHRQRCFCCLCWRSYEPARLWDLTAASTLFCHSRYHTHTPPIWHEHSRMETGCLEHGACSSRK